MVGWNLWWYWVQPSWSKQDQLKEIAQDIFQLGFEYVQGLRLHSLFKQLIPVFSHAHSIKAFLYVQSFLYFYLWQLPLFVHWTSPRKVCLHLLYSLTSHIYTDIYILKRFLLSLLQAKQCHPSQPLLMCQMLPPLNNLQYPFLDLLHYDYVTPEEKVL